MFKLSRIVKEWKESGSLQAHINLCGLWDEETFLTKSGDLAMVLRVKGIDYESLDSISRDHAVKRLEAGSARFRSTRPGLSGVVQSKSAGNFPWAVCESVGEAGR